MLRDLLILCSCAAVAYAWLCAVVAPVVHAVRSMAHHASRAALGALALAVAGLLMWLTLLTLAIVLAMLLEPRAGLALLGSHLFSPGLALGTVVWGAQVALMRRCPRFGDEFEAATALAIVAVFDDDPDTLARVHDLYMRHAAGLMPPTTVSRPAAAA